MASQREVLDSEHGSLSYARLLKGIYSNKLREPKKEDFKQLYTTYPSEWINATVENDKDGSNIHPAYLHSKMRNLMCYAFVNPDVCSHKELHTRFTKSLYGARLGKLVAYFQRTTAISTPGVAASILSTVSAAMIGLVELPNGYFPGLSAVMGTKSGTSKSNLLYALTHPLKRLLITAAPATPEQLRLFKIFAKEDATLLLIDGKQQLLNYLFNTVTGEAAELGAVTLGKAPVIYERSREGSVISVDINMPMLLSLREEELPLINYKSLYHSSPSLYWFVTTDSADVDLVDLPFNYRLVPDMVDVWVKLFALLKQLRQTGVKLIVEDHYTVQRSKHYLTRNCDDLVSRQLRSKKHEVIVRIACIKAVLEWCLQFNEENEWDAEDQLERSLLRDRRYTRNTVGLSLTEHDYANAALLAYYGDLGVIEGFLPSKEKRVNKRTAGHSKKNDLLKQLKKMVITKKAVGLAEAMRLVKFEGSHDSFKKLLHDSDLVLRKMGRGYQVVMKNKESIK